MRPKAASGSRSAQGTSARAQRREARAHAGCEAPRRGRGRHERAQAAHRQARPLGPAARRKHERGGSHTGQHHAARDRGTACERAQATTHQRAARGGRRPRVGEAQERRSCGPQGPARHGQRPQLGPKPERTDANKGTSTPRECRAHGRTTRAGASAMLTPPSRCNTRSKGSRLGTNEPRSHEERRPEATAGRKHERAHAAQASRGGQTPQLEERHGSEGEPAREALAPLATAGGWRRRAARVRPSSRGPSGRRRRRAAAARPPDKWAQPLAAPRVEKPRPLAAPRQSATPWPVLCRAAGARAGRRTP